VIKEDTKGEWEEYEEEEKTERKKWRIIGKYYGKIRRIRLSVD
jgi:hypothetical protein